MKRTKDLTLYLLIVAFTMAIIVGAMSCGYSKYGCPSTNERLLHKHDNRAFNK